MQNLINSMDSFTVFVLLYLFLYPIVTIGIGVFISKKMNKFLIGPIITLLLCLAIELFIVKGFSWWMPTTNTALSIFFVIVALHIQPSKEG